MSQKFPQYVRKYDADGKMVKPVSDAYVAVVTKYYDPDRPDHFVGKTWFYPVTDATVEPVSGGILITQKVRGREQHAFTPFSEILRIDYNDASPEFAKDLEIWTAENMGMSVTEVREMNKRGAEERLRGKIAAEFGIPPEHIGVFDLGDMGDDDDATH